MARRDRRHRARIGSDIQRRSPTWVGRLRYLLGIRARHPWRSWPLRAIRRESTDRWPKALAEDLRQIQVALAGYGVTP